MSSDAVQLSVPQPAAPKIAREFISPGRAQELLATIAAGGNRHRSQAWVARLADMLKNEKFLEAGDTIRISWEGKLLDGQHRLAAIVDSGVGAWMIVVYDLDPKTQDVMDRNKRRSISDVLYIHEYNQPALRAAAVKWVIAIEEQKLVQASKAKDSARLEREVLPLSPDEALAAMEKYPKLGESFRAGSLFKRSVVRYPPSLAVGVHYLMSRRGGQEIADFFFEPLADGTGLEKGDPVWALREQILNQAKVSRKPPTLAYASWTIRAWNAWISGMSPKQFKHYPGSFPVMLDVTEDRVRVLLGEDE